MGAAGGAGRRPAGRSDERGAGRIKALERGVRGLRQVNESCARPRLILRWRSSTAARSHDRLHRRDRPVYGVEPTAMCCRSLRRLSTSMSPGGATPRACRPEGGGTRSCDPNRSGLGGEFPGLRRAQGLAAARPEGDRGGAPDDRRLMRQMGLLGAIAAKHKDDDRQSRRTLPARQGAAIPVPRPNALWVADFTYVATWQGFVYVAFVIDAFAAASSAGGFRDRPDRLCPRCPEQALYHRRPFLHGLVHHSDRGMSMSRSAIPSGLPRPASSRRSARRRQLRECPGGTVIGLFKTEVIRRRGPWRHAEAVEFVTLSGWTGSTIDACLKPIANIPPAEAEARYYAQIAVRPSPPDPSKIASGNPVRFTRPGRDRLGASRTNQLGWALVKAYHGPLWIGCLRRRDQARPPCGT